MGEAPVSELFVELIEWMGRCGLKNAKDMPQPITMQLQQGDDTITVNLNATSAPMPFDGTTLDGFHALIKSEKYLSVAIAAPFGGAIGGFKEDDLIEAFRNAQPSKYAARHTKQGES